MRLQSEQVRGILTQSWSLENSYIKPIQKELFLVKFADIELKLLLKRSEINQITELSLKNRYLILPGKLFLQNRRIKLELHLCRYNREYAKEKKNKKYLRAQSKRKFLDWDE